VFGFGFRNIVMGAMTTLFVFSVLSIPFVIAYLGLPERRRPSMRWFGAIFLGAAAGAALGEILLSIDDLRFVDEVEVRGRATSYSRPRPWPYENSGVLYDPDRGFWAND